MSVRTGRSTSSSTFSKILVMALVAIFLFGVVGFVVAVITASETDAPHSPQATDRAAVAAPRIVLALAQASAQPSPPPSAEPSPKVSPAASLLAPDVAATITMQPVPIVPVARFWSRKEGVARRDIVRALENGKLRSYKRVIIEAGLRLGLEAELDIEMHPDVASGDVAAVERAVRKGALGLLAAIDVSPAVRALDINGRALVGNERITDLDDWPLVVSLPTAEGEGWDQSRTWVLVAGGDSFTDRGVYDSVVRKGRGVDYPFGGGTARVTGFGCCDPVFDANIVPRYVLTGNKGVVRKLFRDAELAIVNHEQPTTDDWAFHRSGLRFSGKPALTRIFTRAGIDWVSLGNNHIKDYGSEGIKDTRRILRKAGIAFSGAGKNLDQARQVSYLKAADTTVAIIACAAVAPAAWAAPGGVSGATPCLDRYLVPDIKKAKRKADFVIVFPHWGVEYTRQPLPSMRKRAARWTKAGADLIVGAHSHVAGAIEDIDGTPVLYSLGNLIFDQNWSTNTMESVILEATFNGSQLVELRLHPYIIHNNSQPNLLDPAKGEGRRLLEQVRRASDDWLDW